MRLLFDGCFYRAGFPPPRTQVPVYDGYGGLVAVLDMGWEDLNWP